MTWETLGYVLLALLVIAVVWVAWAAAIYRQMIDQNDDEF